MTYRCPVCGYPELSEPPRTQSGASYEICPACAFEFGVTDDDLGYSYVAWRDEWIRNGMPWRSEGIDAVPPGWDPRGQLRALDEPNDGSDESTRYWSAND